MQNVNQVLNTQNDISIREPFKNEIEIRSNSYNSVAFLTMKSDSAHLDDLLRGDGPKGMGSVLLNQVCSEARQRGAKLITGSITRAVISDGISRGFSCDANGRPSGLIKFYEKHGFTVTPDGKGTYTIKKYL